MRLESECFTEATSNFRSPAGDCAAPGGGTIDPVAIGPAIVSVPAEPSRKLLVRFTMTNLNSALSIARSALSITCSGARNHALDRAACRNDPESSIVKSKAQAIDQLIRRFNVGYLISGWKEADYQELQHAQIRVY